MFHEFLEAGARACPKFYDFQVSLGMTPEPPFPVSRRPSLSTRLVAASCGEIRGWRDDRDRKYFPRLGAFQWRRDAPCRDTDRTIQRNKARSHPIRKCDLELKSSRSGYRSECRERDSWRQISAQMNAVARSGDINEAVIALRLASRLE
jgi:hypothetical protein